MAIEETNTGTEEQRPTAGGPDTVYIGRQKPVMTYVLAAISALNNSPSVILKARGAAISLAVDVAQITIHRFVQAAQVANIKLDTEELSGQDGRPRNVSTIEIELKAELEPS
jgi:DNA-binding protein|tara:strand:- start:936 stop:1271 length:336 start_codon:yes stop_codon:yes gene_type:complete